MKRWVQLAFLAALLCLGARNASAQAGFAQGQSFRYTPAGLFGSGSSTVTICTAGGAGTPCTPTVTLYSNSSLSTPVSNPLAQCTVSPQVGCIDNFGNFTFYATSGAYTYTVTGQGLTPYGPIPIIATPTSAGSTPNPLVLSAVSTASTPLQINGNSLNQSAPIAIFWTGAGTSATSCLVCLYGNIAALSSFMGVTVNNDGVNAFQISNSNVGGSAMSIQMNNSGEGKFVDTPDGGSHVATFTISPTELKYIATGASPAFSIGAGGLSYSVDVTNGLLLRYLTIPTAGNGQPAIFASVDLTAQAASIGTTTLYAVPSTNAGQYRLSWDAKVTTADGASSTLGALTIVYTDPDGVNQTIVAGALTAAGAIATTATGNATTTVLLGVPITLNCKASTNVTYAFAYASGTGGAMHYNLHLRLEEL